MGDAVKGDDRIAADQFESFMAGLGDEQPVKWVAMMIGQRLHGQGVRNGDRQRQEAIGGHGRFEVIGSVELA